MGRPGAVIIEGHVQGLANARALGQNDIPIVVVDKSKYNFARYSRYCGKFHQSPDYLANAFIDFVIELAETENINGWVLLPSNDHAVYNISKHRQVLTDYYKVITPSLEVIENIYNKETLLRIAKNIGVPTPQSFFNCDHDLSQFSLAFPVITKGKKGLSFYKKMGKKAYVSNNRSQLRNSLSELSKRIDISETFTQTIIPGSKSSNTISFTSFAIDGEIKAYWMGEKIRQHPWEFGTATFCQSVYIEDLVPLSRKLLGELNYTGVSEIEYIRDAQDGDYKLIEINPRTWLWVGLAIASGINFPMMIYNYLTNTHDDYPKTYDVGKKWRNTLTDRLSSYKSILSGKLNSTQYRKSLKDNDIVYGVKSDDDPWPFRMASFLFFSRLLGRHD